MIDPDDERTTLSRRAPSASDSVTLPMSPPGTADASPGASGRVGPASPLPDERTVVVSRSGVPSDTEQTIPSAKRPARRPGSEPAGSVGAEDAAPDRAAPAASNRVAQTPSGGVVASYPPRQAPPATAVRAGVEPHAPQPAVDTAAARAAARRRGRRRALVAAVAAAALVIIAVVVLVALMNAG
ncbi:hypothetical protein AB1K54_00960 [Microbacterium sp. BWT-B31]|uniref:hypothetical protein n=1 Tax=Microbacterium sp. BWT-B31 TaxID=3232072 RepID=UPI00352839EE